jgi:hypothetical protein
MAGGRRDSLDTDMQRPLRAPDRRSPKSVSRALRRDAAFARIVVAFALVLSIVTLVYLLNLDISVV